MSDLSLQELELKAKNRGIKGYKSMSINKLLCIHAPEPVEENMEEENSNTDKIPKHIRNLFRLEKDKNIKVRVIRDIRTLYESDKEDYYKPIGTGHAFSSSYIEYESNGDKYKTLSIKEYLDEIRPYLNNLIDNHKSQGEWKIQLTMAINFFSS